MGRAFRIAIGVSIIAQSRIFSGACTPCRILATLMISPGCVTFGTRIASGAASQAASRSAVPPRRLERVHPDDEFARAITAALHRGADAVPRNRLGIRGDGVLEVEDEGVGGEGLGLLQRPLVRTRHVEDA